MSNTIHIQTPSLKLIDFFKKAQSQKEERMSAVCDKYRKLLK